MTLYTTLQANNDSSTLLSLPQVRVCEESKMLILGLLVFICVYQTYSVQLDMSKLSETIRDITDNSLDVPSIQVSMTINNSKYGSIRIENKLKHPVACILHCGSV